MGTTRVPLLSGAYKQDNLLFQAQRCINLFVEQQAEGSQQTVPAIHYQTPGLTLIQNAPTPGVCRGAFLMSNGDVYVVANSIVYYLDQGFVYHQIGTIQAGTTNVSMADNGQTIILVDGTNTGYCIDLFSRVMAPIGDPNYLPADRVGYQDSFFILHPVGNSLVREQIYISLGNVTTANLTATTGGTAFNALDVVSKNGYPDPIGAFAIVHREIWLIGTQTAEVWYSSGAADFPFSPLPGAFIQHGILAPWSLATQDLSTFFLSTDPQGTLVVMRGTGYTVRRISTHSIERQFKTYPSPQDAYGFCFQLLGHAFYALSFRNADRTWLFDLQTNEWSEWGSFDTVNGVQHRHRAFAHVNAYGQNVIFDWQTSACNLLDPYNYTENGNEIPRLRSIPHLVSDGKLVTYDQLQVDFQPGTIVGTNNQGTTTAPSLPADYNIQTDGTTNNILADSSTNDIIVDTVTSLPHPFAPTSTSISPPQMFVRWSDDRGASYRDPIVKSMGGTGEYYMSMIYNNLGQARDRVFELTWSGALNTDLKGAWVTYTPCED